MASAMVIPASNTNANASSQSYAPRAMYTFSPKSSSAPIEFLKNGYLASNGIFSGPDFEIIPADFGIGEVNRIELKFAGAYSASYDIMPSNGRMPTTRGEIIAFDVTLTHSTSGSSTISAHGTLELESSDVGLIIRFHPTTVSDINMGSPSQLVITLNGSID